MLCVSAFSLETHFLQEMQIFFENLLKACSLSLYLQIECRCTSGKNTDTFLLVISRILIFVLLLGLFKIGSDCRAARSPSIRAAPLLSVSVCACWEFGGIERGEWLRFL